MNLTLPFHILVLSTVAACAPASAQATPDGALSRESPTLALHGEVEALLKRHHEKPITENSPGYGVFNAVGQAARGNPEFVDELINLTAIREAPPDTTEKLSATRLSPAGRELLMLDSDIRQVIRMRQDKGGLSEWQNEVLNDVIRLSDLRDQRMAEAAKAAAPSVQPDRAKRLSPPPTPADASPAPAVPGTKSTPADHGIVSKASRWLWPAAAAVIAAAFGLLLLRRI